MFTGNKLDNVKEIHSLDLKALTPNTKSHFYFRASDTPLKQGLYIPVCVIRGQGDPNKKFLITSGVHGDELNGVFVCQELFREIDPSSVEGTIVIIPAINLNGMSNGQRCFRSLIDGGDEINLNRFFPGEKDSNHLYDQFLTSIWDHILFPDTLHVIDVHSQTKGTSYPLFVFSDYRNHDAKLMAQELCPDIIKIDNGEHGTLETSFIENNIPAVTFEVGEGKQRQRYLIDQAKHGIKNVLIKLGYYNENPHTFNHTPFTAKEMITYTSDSCGLCDIHFPLMSHVKKGDHVATLFDLFGNEIQKYHSKSDGIILSIRTDPVVESGEMLFKLVK